MTLSNSRLPSRMKEPIRVSPANQLLGRFRNLWIVSQYLSILKFHSSARIIVGIVRGKKKPPGAQEFNRLRQLRLFGLDGKIKIVLKVVTGGFLILLEKNMGWI